MGGGEGGGEYEKNEFQFDILNQKCPEVWKNVGFQGSRPRSFSSCHIILFYLQIEK
jgi:hypothetical protein